MSLRKSDSLNESVAIKQMVPLDAEKLFRAKEMILEQHPLSQIPIDEVFPMTKPIIKYLCFRKSRQVQEQSEQKETLLEDQTQTQESFGKMPGSLKKKRSYVEKLKQKLRITGFDRRNTQNFNDPFIQYGYGVVAFFNLLKVMIALFIGLSLLSIPMIVIYSSQSGPISSYYKLAQTTLGNLGSSFSACFQAPLDLNSLTIDCGEKIIAEISAVGIIPYNSSRNKRACWHKDPETHDQCFKLYDLNLMQAFEQECISKSNCTLESLGNYFIPEQLNNPSLNECLNQKSLVYVQAKCYHTYESLKQNRDIGLLGVCIGMFICFIYVFVIYFQYQTNELNFILWDLQTVTANDYTVDLFINEKILRDYDNYCESHPILDQNKCEHLSEFLKGYIETHIQKYAIEADRQDLIDQDKLRVLMLQFDFQQGELIKLMIQRGQKIKDLQFQKRRQTEAKINKYLIRNKQTLMNPIRCFVTFEYTEGHNFFLQMISDNTDIKSEEHLGIIAESAPIPGNIIWQERNKSNSEIFSKKFLSLVLIIVILFFTMLGIFYIRQYGSKGIAPFKKQNCDWVWDQYGDKLKVYANQAFQESSDYFENLTEQNVDQEDLNLVSCYCIKVHGSVFYSGFRKRFNITVGDISTDVIISDQEKQMCQLFEWNYLSAQFINFFASESVVVINFILRFVIIFIVKFIGYDTETKQTSRILICVFIVQFINTDLIILFMNADLSQTGWLFLKTFNRGIYPDFTILWYKDIGLTLINTMIFNIYWPVLEFFAFYSLRVFLRLLDRGLCSCNTWKTKSVTIQKYVDLYSGPEYMIHYKYSAILNITFITFMFGAGMPILFPIALASFLTLYAVERLMVAYCYRQPPMMDETLNRLTIKILLYAPLLYCTVGFWMFDNVQIFQNKVGVKKYLNDHIQTQHTVLEALKINHASPLLFVVSIFLLVVITQRWAMRFVKKVLNLDPQIYQFKPQQISFVEALNDDQRRWMIKEEFMAREKFGIKKLSDEMLQKLQQEKYNEQTELIGVMTYQILDNPLYQKYFQYVPEILDNRDKYIFDDWVFNSLGQSDYVKKNLNTFYLPKDTDKN